MPLSRERRQSSPSQLSRYHGGEDGVRSDEAARHAASGLTRHVSRGNDPDVIPHIPVLVERRCALSLEKAGGSRNPDYHARINARHGRIVMFKHLSNHADSRITADAGAKAAGDHDVHAAAKTHDRYR